MSTTPKALRLLERPEVWSMMPGERAALEGVLSELKPTLSIEIGTYRGGSLIPISAHSERVHAFDRERRPELTKERFPNVTFHTGDSHELLPRFLHQLAEDGGKVDFALVDGDHTAVGARQDVEDLLNSPALDKAVILLHDTLNKRVRGGLEQIDYESFGKVTFVDFDFVPGRVRSEGALKDEFWSGMGLLVTGWQLGPEDYWPGLYPLPDVYDAFADVLAGGEPTRRLGYEQALELDRELVEQREIARMMKDSLSWRITAPLRGARNLGRNLRGAR